TEALDAAALRLEAARGAFAAAGQAMAGVHRSAEAFQFLVDSMGAAGPDDSLAGEAAEGPFVGDANQARERYHELRAAWTAAQDAASIADDRVRAAADELSQYATARRFEALDTPVRQQIV